MTQKHTPGPWGYDTETSMVQAPSDWTDEGGKRHHDFRYPRVIANVADDWDARSHGALIAAAPELLAALKTLLPVLDKAPETDNVFGILHNAAMDAEQAAFAAIAKAEGRS